MRTSSVMVDELRFCLFLAKIAHGFFVAQRDHFPDYRPLLPDIIRRQPSPLPLAYLIGGEPKQGKAAGNAHTVALLKMKVAAGDLLIAQIRFFARLNTPTYYAVTAASPSAYDQMNKL